MNPQNDRLPLAPVVLNLLGIFAGFLVYGTAGWVKNMFRRFA